MEQLIEKIAALPHLNLSTEQWTEVKDLVETYVNLLSSGEEKQAQPNLSTLLKKTKLPKQTLIAKFVTAWLEMTASLVKYNQSINDHWQRLHPNKPLSADDLLDITMELLPFNNISLHLLEKEKKIDQARLIANGIIDFTLVNLDVAIKYKLQHLNKIADVSSSVISTVKALQLENQLNEFRIATAKYQTIVAAEIQKILNIHAKALNEKLFNFNSNHFSYLSASLQLNELLKENLALKNDQRLQTLIKQLILISDMQLTLKRPTSAQHQYEEFLAKFTLHQYTLIKNWKINEKEILSIAPHSNHFEWGTSWFTNVRPDLSVKFKFFTQHFSSSQPKIEAPSEAHEAHSKKHA